MKKFFQCLGALIYGLIIGYLLWLVFYLITPYIMGIWWLLLIVGGFIAGFIANTNCILSIPVYFLTKGNMVAKIISIVPLLYWGYCSVLLPWGLDMEYGFLQYIVGIILTIMFLMSYIASIAIPFVIEDE